MDGIANFLCVGLLSGYFISQIVKFFKEQEENRTKLLISSIKNVETLFEQKIENTKNKLNSDMEDMKNNIFNVLKEHIGKSLTEKGNYSTFGFLEKQGDQINEILDNFSSESDRGKNLILDFKKEIAQRTEEE
jgi:hypothetical protein